MENVATDLRGPFEFELGSNVHRCMRWIVPVLGCLLLANCAAPEPRVWHADPAFTPEERSKILAGAAWIAEKTSTDTPEVVWDGPQENGHGIYRGVPADCGCAGLGGALIVLRPGANLTEVAAHEFGHSLGMGHTRFGIMNTSDPLLLWSTEDQAEWAAASRR